MILTGSWPQDNRPLLRTLPAWLYPRGGDLGSCGCCHDVTQSKVRPPSVLSTPLPSTTPTHRRFLLTSGEYEQLYVYAFLYRTCTRNFNVNIHADAPPSCVSAPACFGLVSRSGNANLHVKVLTEIWNSLESQNQSDCVTLMRSFLRAPIPLNGDQLFISITPSDKPTISSTDKPIMSRDDSTDKLFPHSVISDSLIKSPISIPPNSASFSALFNAISPANIVTCLSLLFLEQKLVLVSSALTSVNVFAICESLRSLLFPFSWAHVYVPAVPDAKISDAIDPPDWPAETGMHPLKCLEVPAPLLAGVAFVRDVNIHADEGLKTAELHENGTGLIVERYPDLNVLDLDSGDFYLCEGLPVFPKKSHGIFLKGIQGLVEQLKVDDETLLASKEVDEVLVFNVPPVTPPETLTPVLHSFVLESLSRLLFPFRGFVSEGHFSTDLYLKQMSRVSTSEDIAWLKVFLSTQAWDIFIRTPGNSAAPLNLLEVACDAYRGVFRDEAAKVKCQLPKAWEPPSKNKSHEIFSAEVKRVCNLHFQGGTKRWIWVAEGKEDDEEKNTNVDDVDKSKTLESQNSFSLVNPITEISLGIFQPSHLIWRVLAILAGKSNFQPWMLPVEKGKGTMKGWVSENVNIHAALSEELKGNSCSECRRTHSLWEVLRQTAWSDFSNSAASGNDDKSIEEALTLACLDCGSTCAPLIGSNPITKLRTESVTSPSSLAILSSLRVEFCNEIVSVQDMLSRIDESSEEDAEDVASEASPQSSRSSDDVFAVTLDSAIARQERKVEEARLRAVARVKSYRNRK